MNNIELDYNWPDIAFASKKPWRSRSIVFILAPCSLSDRRLRQIIATYLKVGDVVVGIAEERYIDGLGGHDAFQTLDRSSVVELQQKVAGSPSPHKLYTLKYAQRDEQYVVEKLKPRLVVGIRGSWYRMFHVRPLFYTLFKYQIPYELVSRFVDDSEARSLADTLTNEESYQLNDGSEEDMFRQVDQIANHSLDYIYRTGCLLARGDSLYQPISYGYNKVVPYQTHAMQHGSLREDNFSPPNDANHYDTIHAEMDLLVRATKDSVSLKNATLFINLLPCPNCARTLSQTELKEVVYQHDHSDGYAAQLLETSGIAVRRYIKKEES